jgi:hypothetical protein
MSDQKAKNARQCQFYLANQDFDFASQSLCTSLRRASAQKFVSYISKTGLPDFFLTQFTKIGENIPNCNLQLNGRNIFQIGVEYTNLLHSTALQNLPKLGFFV